MTVKDGTIVLGLPECWSGLLQGDFHARFRGSTEWMWLCPSQCHTCNTSETSVCCFWLNGKKHEFGDPRVEHSSGFGWHYLWCPWTDFVFHPRISGLCTTELPMSQGDMCLLGDIPRTPPMHKTLHFCVQGLCSEHGVPIRAVVTESDRKEQVGQLLYPTHRKECVQP